MKYCESKKKDEKNKEFVGVQIMNENFKQIQNITSAKEIEIIYKGFMGPQPKLNLKLIEETINLVDIPIGP
jgi:hypothetical protein